MCAVIGIKDPTTKLEDVRQYISSDKNYFSILNRPVQDLLQRDEDLDLITTPARGIRARATDPTTDQVEVEVGTYTFGVVISQFAGVTLAAVPAASAGNKRIDLIYFRIDTGTVVRSPSAEAANYGAVVKINLPAGVDALPLAYIYVGETGPDFQDGLAVDTDGAIEDIRPSPGSSLGRQLETVAGNILSDVSGGSAGSAETVARSNHRHVLNIDATLPTSLVPGNTASAGVAGTYALIDHIHLIPTQSNPAAFLSDTIGGSAGVGASFARDDHRHTVNVGLTTPPRDAGAGSPGASNVYSRDDHFHILNVPVGGVPIAIAPGNTASHGVATTYAPSDHTHALDGVVQNGVGTVNITMLWGEITGTTGAIKNAGSGSWSSSRLGVGRWRITLSPTLPSIPTVVCTAIGTTTNRYVATPTTITASLVDISVQFSGGLVDRDFSFIILFV